MTPELRKWVAEQRKAADDELAEAMGKRVHIMTQEMHQYVNELCDEITDLLDDEVFVLTFGVRKAERLTLARERVLLQIRLETTK